MQTVQEPDLEASYQFLKSELQGLAQRRGHMVQVVADCEVAYRGRASSTLQRGERLVMLKPDGTLLVHTASKAKPVNWQPPGASFDVAQEDNHVLLTAVRTKPAEELVHIRFYEVRLLVAVPLRDTADLALVGSEDDLQQLLFENPELVEPGFVPARRERDTKRGYYDLDGHDAEGRRLIVEVKRTTAGVKEAQQLWRYVEQLRGGNDPSLGDDDESTSPSDGESNARIRGILIAPRIAPKARSLLGDHDLQWRELSWEDLLPKIEAMRRAGQASLGAF